MAHKIVSAHLSRPEEVLACYARITAPVLAVQAADNEMGNWYKGSYTLAQYHERLKSVPNVQVQEIADAAHMLHHDQPEQLARVIEAFLL
jgi:pimeloyl-ACP methyl ester carboxylesterase